MSRGSTHGMGSAFISWETGAKASRDGFGSSGLNSRQIVSFWIMSVSTCVGWMLLTRIMCGASSSASVRINPTTPCLADT